MKTLLMILLLLIIPVVTIGQNLKALDDKYGFREAKFEMLLSSFKNLKKVNDYIHDELYDVTNADLNIGDYKINNLQYEFYKGQLFMIKMKIKNMDYVNIYGIIRIFETAYGKANWPRNYNAAWEGEKVRLTIYFFNEVPASPWGISFTCIKLFNERLKDYESEKEQKLKDAAKKL